MTVPQSCCWLRRSQRRVCTYIRTSLRKYVRMAPTWLMAMMTLAPVMKPEIMAEERKLVIQPMRNRPTAVYRQPAMKATCRGAASGAGQQGVQMHTVGGVQPAGRVPVCVCVWEGEGGRAARGLARGHAKCTRGLIAATWQAQLWPSPRPPAPASPPTHPPTQPASPARTALQCTAPRAVPGRRRGCTSSAALGPLGCWGRRSRRCHRGRCLGGRCPAGWMSLPRAPPPADGWERW